jgi:hypothetical protein
MPARESPVDGETLGGVKGPYVQRGMRPSLRHQLGERRRTRRIRGAHRPDPAPEPLATAPQALSAAPEADIATRELGVTAQVPDIAAQRVREAGGPSDLATYACECGYLFAASVTTTVGCPHCGTQQAW